MVTLRKHILFSLSVFFLTGGLACLNLHSLTHFNTQESEPHQANAPDTAKQLIDDCALCILSAFGFAEPEDGEFVPVQNGSEQIVHASLSFLSHQGLPIAGPRAPPVS